MKLRLWIWMVMAAGCGDDGAQMAETGSTSLGPGSSGGSTNGSIATSIDPPSGTASSAGSGSETSPPLGCGNDIVEADEQCDGSELDGWSCLQLGFDGGALACANDCTFDTSACASSGCGNGVIDGSDQCDGDEFDGETCETRGFGAGELTCTDTCVIDTAGCCGDSNVGGDEDCDGEDLAELGCVDLGLGFTAGALACATDCTFDTAGCTTCGDGAIEVGEDCDSGMLGGAMCDTIGMGFVGGVLGCDDATCTFDTTLCDSCGNGVVDAGEDCDSDDVDGAQCPDADMSFTGGQLACDNATCTFETGGCTNFPLPVAGELVITEVMQNPNQVDDPDGEWFELHNPGAATLQLLGCTVEGDPGSDNGFSIDVDLALAGGGFATLATASAGGPGFAADYGWDPAAFDLGNADDELRLVCAAATVDEVAYDNGATFPDGIGSAMSLDPGSYDVALNDDGGNWCLASASYNGDFGTPGAVGGACTGATHTIDFCRLQFPTAISDPEGTIVSVFGRLFIAGLTDGGPLNDPSPNVIGYLGYGPDGTDPAVDATWTWLQASPNPGWDGSMFGVPDEDEYQVEWALPPQGTYDYAFRFTGDSGSTFSYCDADAAGSTNGYQIANAGDLVSLPGGTTADLYFSEYVEGSGLNKALEVYNPTTAMLAVDTCEVRVYSNGNTIPSSTISLVGAIAPDDVYVICNLGIDDAAASDDLTGSMSHNGNDALELYCGQTVDSFGQVGNDPGAQWSGGGVGTQNETLRRDCSVTAGDPIPDDVFDPSLEWNSFAQDDLTDLGQYVCP